jgi:hypothetical protein
MPNFELTDDEILTVPILTQTATGTTEPAPVGDVFTVVSSNASLNAVIGTTAAGNPAVVMNALVAASPGITITVSDSAGLVSAVQIVDIVPDNTPTNVVLDFADATSSPQPAPTAPGP